ncbi:hypothetical protein BH23ACT11_BH23ACT11_04340 [soil metagenome]
MNRLLLLTTALLMLTFPALAQDNQWQFQSNFPPDILETDGNGLHGVAIDGEGKIWIFPFGPDPIEAVRLVHIYNPDGTTASFSPLRSIEMPDAGQTLAAFTTPRGLAAGHDGHIIISHASAVFKVNHQTGAGMAHADFGSAATQATVDAEGNIYVGSVLPGNPIRMYDSSLNFLENVREESPTFARAHLVSPDGQTFYETNFETTYAIIHQRADEFAPFDSVGIAFRGMRIESSAFHPVSGNLWVSAGNNLNRPNQDDQAERFWHANTWYEFNPADLSTPLDSLVWFGCVSFDADGLCLQEGDEAPRENVGRPRGMAFTDDGLSVHLIVFTASHMAAGGNSQIHSWVSVSNEPGTRPGLFTLSGNYPNPFTNTTTIEFSLESPGHVSLRVYDLLGREVATIVDQTLSADNHTATLDAGNLAAGTYIYVLAQDGQRLSSKPMQVVR